MRSVKIATTCLLALAGLMLSACGSDQPSVSEDGSDSVLERVLENSPELESVDDMDSLAESTCMALDRGDGVDMVRIRNEAAGFSPTASIDLATYAVQTQCPEYQADLDESVAMLR